MSKIEERLRATGLELPAPLNRFSLLQQFVDRSAGHILTQTVSLGLVQIAAAACAHSLVIVCAAAVSSAVARRRSVVALQRYLLATALSALAVRLMIERRAAG